MIIIYYNAAGFQKAGQLIEPALKGTCPVSAPTQKSSQIHLASALARTPTTGGCSFNHRDFPLKLYDGYRGSEERVTTNNVATYSRLIHIEPILSPEILQPLAISASLHFFPAPGPSFGLANENPNNPKPFESQNAILIIEIKA